MGYAFDWGLPFREPYRDWLLAGLLNTAVLTAVSTAGSLVLGAGVALGRVSERRTARAACGVYVELFRNVPTLSWILFFYFGLPQLLGSTLSATLNAWDGLALSAACAALTLTNGAFVAETVRSGIQALPATQKAAGLALGLHPLRVSLSVLLPQALRISLPALGSRLIHNLHNTALALVISLPELTWQTQRIESITFKGLEAVTLVSLAFVGMSAAMSLGFKLLERRGARWGLG